ncbi:hypothetical protein ACB092_11G151200 [Castanea dentata]
MSDNSSNSTNAPIINKELEKGDDSNVLNPISTSSSVVSSKHLQQIPPETNESSSKGKQSSLTEREIQIEVWSTESKEQQEKSVQTELTENLEAFYKLLENISKSLDELETLINFTSSSSNATTESLADVKSFFNKSVDNVLLNDAWLSKFRKAAALLFDKTSILGKNKGDLLKNFNVDLDREVNRFRTAVEKEKKRAELLKNRSKYVEALDTYKTALQPCRDEMQMMASKHEEMKKNLREYEMIMIQKMPPFQQVYSQQSSIDTEISSLRVNEQLLQQEDQEIDSLRREPSISWSGLIAAFYN